MRLHQLFFFALFAEVVLPLSAPAQPQPVPVQQTQVQPPFPGIEQFRGGVPAPSNSPAQAQSLLAERARLRAAALAAAQAAARRAAMQPQPQPPPAPQPDPLMSLLLSQPKTEIASNVVATVAFDPPVVRPGEKSVYRVMFNALEVSIEWPDKLPAPAELDLHKGGHGQILQFTGTNYVPRTTFNYHTRPSRSGLFTVPQFTVNVYGKPVVVPAAQLTVAATLPSTPPPPQLVFEVPETNLYVGQAVKVRVMLSAPASPTSIMALAQVQINGDGVLAEQGVVRPQAVQVPGGATVVAANAYETMLTPIQAGKLSVFAQGYSVGNRFSGPVVVSGPGVFMGNPLQYTLLDSEPVELEARPLPRQGELPGFAGAIGSFSLDPPQLSTNTLRVGDAVKLSVTVHGDGNLARLAAPPAPQARDWQIFTARNEPASPVPPYAATFGPIPTGPQAAATLTFTLVPLTDAARATPAIPFSYFDPKRGAYVDLTIPPVAVAVEPGTVPADLQALQRADAAAPDSEKEPVLAGLAAAPGMSAASLAPLQRSAWFPLVQLAPALLFGGLWGWDRRRRFLEQHPQIVLRRRARRALRRERRAMRRAARTGDAPQFASAAVAAMRVACAPFYPAEPRALVGADVLPLLPGADSQPAVPPRSVEVVRRFFAVTDAVRFGNSGARLSNRQASEPPTPEATGLLTLQPEIEQVLERLDERLRA